MVSLLSVTIKRLGSIRKNILGVARHRKQLMSKARGKFLDVACGTGPSFSMLPVASEVTAIDLSPQMLKVAQRKAKDLRLGVKIQVMDVQKLHFPGASFETVTSALSSCTFPDPVQTLREMKRVCRPDGLILLLEHGHSSMLAVAGIRSL